MDTRKPTEMTQETRTPVAWKCSDNGKYFAYFKEKRCRYCLPVYDEKEFNDALSAAERGE